MDGRRRHESAWARGFGLSLWLAAGIAGTAAAQSGTIRFQGAITEPSCGFVTGVQVVRATCQSPAGRPVSTDLSAANAGKKASTRVGVARLKLEPIPGRPGAADAYIVVATYL
jgi:hypothetical protein